MRHTRGAHHCLDAISPLKFKAVRGALPAEEAIMKIGVLVRTIVLLVAFSGWLASEAAEIVYDNSSTYLQADYESANEYGDEVILAGAARIVTEIQLEYYGEFVRNGDELVRLRFYENTGPIWNGIPEYRLPASPPLYEDTFQISTGFQVLVVTVPNIQVPDHFTWTVQFLGISQAANDRAGLLHYHPPSVGQSFDDFWERLPDGWAPLARDDVKNNFGARILAIQGAPQLTITKAGNNVVLSWPQTEGYTLQANTDLRTTNWTVVNQAPVLISGNYQVILPLAGGIQFFRLRST
jgi:hypothetical protein